MTICQERHSLVIQIIHPEGHMNLPQSLSLLLLFLLPFVSLGQVPAYSTDQGILRNGQETFNANCVSCHGIDEGAFGPKLGGVTTVRSLRELIDFTRNPQKFVDKADERTVALVSEYKSVMPAFEQLTDAELASIFSFIESETKKKNSQPKW